MFATAVAETKGQSQHSRWAPFVRWACTLRASQKGSGRYEGAMNARHDAVVDWGTARHDAPVDWRGGYTTLVAHCTDSRLHCPWQVASSWVITNLMTFNI